MVFWLPMAIRRRAAVAVKRSEYSPIFPCSGETTDCASDEKHELMES